MGLRSFHVAPPQAAQFGITHANIVDKLDSGNWKKKATCRVLRGDQYPTEAPVYIWIAEGEQYAAIPCYPGARVYVGDKENRRAATVYIVAQVVTGSTKTFDTKYFSTLKEALSYANGEDGNDLGRETRPAKGVHEYPSEEGAPIYISSGPWVPRAHRLNGRKQ